MIRLVPLLRSVRPLAIRSVQLLAVVAQLKDIALRMKQFQDTAGKSASCSGSASSDSAPIVEVSLGAGGLVVACK